MWGELTAQTFWRQLTLLWMKYSATKPFYALEWTLRSSICGQLKTQCKWVRLDLVSQKLFGCGFCNGKFIIYAIINDRSPVVHFSCVNNSQIWNKIVCVPTISKINKQKNHTHSRSYVVIQTLWAVKLTTKYRIGICCIVHSSMCLCLCTMLCWRGVREWHTARTITHNQSGTAIIHNHCCLLSLGYDVTINQ